MSYEEELMGHKTGRIVVLSILLLALAFLFFLFKIEACKPSPENCKDEFYEIKNDGYTSNHTCSPGAVIEVISAPPAPKAGIVCHCPNHAKVTEPTKP
jgi:hypothetical protein